LPLGFVLIVTSGREGFAGGRVGLGNLLGFFTSSGSGGMSQLLWTGMVLRGAVLGAFGDGVGRPRLLGGFS
jgi:hypothetical protein